jgi:LCP family protein required for cell wall assembly
MADPRATSAPRSRASWAGEVLRRAFVTFVVLSTVLVGIGLVSSWYLNRAIHHVNVSGLTRGSRGIENILLVGSTDRCSLKHQNVAFGLCSQGVTGINSDVVMILHLDPAARAAAVLSIPRDTFVPNARSTGGYKIDAALYEGPSQLVRAIEEDFAIPINHYVELNFDGFQAVVDAIGGIKMYFPEPVHDDLSGLDVRTPGCQALNGFTALEVARARHLRYRPPSVHTNDPESWPQDPQSDLSRIRRNHEFLRVVAARLAQRDLANPLTDHTLLNAIAPQMTVDSGFTVADMVNLLLAFHHLDPNQVPQLTLPVTVDTNTSFIYKGTDYGNVALPVEPDDQRVIDQFLSYAYPGDTMHAKPLPRPADVAVAVQNGSGRTDQAAMTVAALSRIGFRATAAADATPSGTVSETVVAYNDLANRAAAEAVARALDGIVILAHEPTTTGAPVTVITGTDFAIHTPTRPAVSATTTTRATSGASDTTTTTTSPAQALTSKDLTSPSAASDQLAEFDPRSCDAPGGPGA